MGRGRGGGGPRGKNRRRGADEKQQLPKKPLAEKEDPRPLSFPASLPPSDWRCTKKKKPHGRPGLSFVGNPRRSFFWNSKKKTNFLYIIDTSFFVSCSLIILVHIRIFPSAGPQKNEPKKTGYRPMASGRRRTKLWGIYNYIYTCAVCEDDNRK